MDITNSFLTANFHLLYTNSTQQMDNLDQTIKSLQNTYIPSLKKINSISDNSNLGLSIAGLAMAIVGITKK